MRGATRVGGKSGEFGGDGEDGPVTKSATGKHTETGKRTDKRAGEEFLSNGS